MMRSAIGAAAVAALVFSAAAARAGGCLPTDAGTLLQPGPHAGDTFGYGVALDGDAAVVGAPQAPSIDPPPPLFEFGTITMFRRDALGNWSGETELSNPRDYGISDGFGQRVALSGDFAVTNARPVNGLPGVVFLFGFNGSAWAFSDSLLSTDAFDDTSSVGLNTWGIDFAIDGDRLAVFRPDTTGAGNPRICTFFYDGGSWGGDAVLVNPDGDVQDQFGTSCAISGDVLVVGTPYYGPGPATGKGAIHVFRHDGAQWNFEQRVDSPSARNGELYGRHVAIHGNTIAVAAPNTHLTPALNSEGAVYVVEFDGAQWVNVARLTASDAAAQDQLGGTSVDVDGDVVLAGAPLHGVNPTDSGVAYVYHRPPGGWVDETEDAKLAPPTGGSFNNFGWSVGVSGETALIGEPGNDELLTNGGKGWLYSLGCGGASAVAEVAGAAQTLGVFGTPNPFSTETAIRFALPRASRVRLSVHDASGRLVATLADGALSAGAHSVRWDEPAPAGVYFAVLRSGDAAASCKLVRVR
jgi:hypothetical protein